MNRIKKKTISLLLAGVMLIGAAPISFAADLYIPREELQPILEESHEASEESDQQTSMDGAEQTVMPNEEESSDENGMQEQDTDGLFIPETAVKPVEGSFIEDLPVKEDAVLYVEAVPVTVDWAFFAIINVATLVICVLALVIPSYLISNIHPARSIRFE